MSSERYALISVSDKQGVDKFGKGLVEAGYTILSTGGTLRYLHEKDVPATPISEFTGSPEILDGRVKTLHPKIHGGILALREEASHQADMRDNHIKAIDIVAVNLYPFQETIAREGVQLSEAIENIDIGGPTMVRASAKNFKYVTVITDPSDYPEVLEQIQKNEKTSEDLRKNLAVKAFKHTADYDSAIDQYLSRTLLNKPALRLSFHNGQKLRYGENNHQNAEFFREPDGGEATLGTARQLHGKELSYNNIVDADAALEAVRDLSDVPAVAIIKHTNPCGYATGNDLSQAFTAAWQGDPVSAFGSVIACSRPVDMATAQQLKGRFVEILMAPSFHADALDFLRKKSKDIRLLELGNISKPLSRKVYKHLPGGILAQDRDVELFSQWESVGETSFPESKKSLAQFCWIACKHVKSNAIVMAWEYSKGRFQVLAIGPGQPNRIDSNVRLCQPRVRDFAKNMVPESEVESKSLELFGELVMASDAFFPFDDNVTAAANAGIRYIVQPGGSKRDQDVINTCNRLGVAMVFTGTRHFRH